MLDTSNISKEEMSKNPQAVLDVLEFYTENMKSAVKEEDGSLNEGDEMISLPKIDFNNIQHPFKPQFYPIHDVKATSANSIPSRFDSASGSTEFPPGGLSGGKSVSNTELASLSKLGLTHSQSESVSALFLAKNFANYGPRNSMAPPSACQACKAYDPILCPDRRIRWMDRIPGSLKASSI